MGDESIQWQRLAQACLEQADQCALPAARAAFEELAAKYRELAERRDLAIQELTGRRPLTEARRAGELASP